MKQPYWFVRVFEPRIQPDGSVKEVRAKHFLGWAEGPEKIDKRAAELARDKVLARANGLSQPPEKAGQPPEGDYILFGRLVAMYVEGQLHDVTPGYRDKVECLLKCHVLPYFSGQRLSQIDHHTVQVWANGLKGARGSRRNSVSLMGRIFEYAANCQLYMARNPAKKINLGRDRGLREQRIPTPQQMAEILDGMDRLAKPIYRLMAETALVNGMRISEVLGLRWKSIEMETGRFDINERLYMGKLDVCKTASSVRRGCFLHLLPAVRDLWIENGKPPGDAFVFDRMDGSGMPPHYGTLVKLFKGVAADIGFDYPGFGWHSLRRANITWRSAAGGANSIEVARTAGHSKVHQTVKYLKISDERTEDTARSASQLWLVPAKKRKAG